MSIDVVARHYSLHNKCVHKLQGFAKKNYTSKKRPEQQIGWNNSAKSPENRDGLLGSQAGARAQQLQQGHMVIAAPVLDLQPRLRPLPAGQAGG